MLFAALLRCTSYNGNAIFSGNQRQSISFAQDSTVRAEYLVRAGLDGSRRTRRFAQSISFAQDSTVRAGLDGSRRVSRSRRTRRFAQDSTVRAGLDGSRRTRLFSQDSTVRAGLDGSRRTRRFSQTELDGSRRTRRFAQDSTLLAATAPHTSTRTGRPNSSIRLISNSCGDKQTYLPSVHYDMLVRLCKIYYVVLVKSSDKLLNH